MRLKLSQRRCSGMLMLSCIALGVTLSAQSAPSPAKDASLPGATVTFDGKALFSVQSALSFSAQARSAAISTRIHDISKDPLFKPQSLSVADSGGATYIMAGDLIVMSVTDQDARASGKSRTDLAQEDAQKIRNALVAVRHEYSVRSILLGSLYALLATAILFLLLRLMALALARGNDKVNSWRESIIPSLRIQEFEILPADRIADLVIGLGKLLHLAAILLAIYFYLSLILDLIPWTRGYAQILFGYFFSPLKLVATGFLAFLPNLFFIAVIVVIARYAIKIVRILFTEIQKQTITLPQFYPEWAEPTFKIVRALILILTAIAIFPYLPGAKSSAFRGISIFVGVLLSLGSTSAVANIVAGVILTYMRAFKIGDRVQIADTVGDVIEKTLLVTRVRTIKNVEITIANAMVLNSHIINFSSSAQRDGLILHTSVTIGYDAPWRTVHQLLIDAALECEDILKEPRPFVYQTALDDFYVHYEINASTDQPSRMAKIYSDLHTTIQDKFNQAGVEIMSSHYSNLRDGNKTTIPANYLPPDYLSPSFHLGTSFPPGASSHPGTHPPPDPSGQS